MHNMTCVCASAVWTVTQSFLPFSSLPVYVYSLVRCSSQDIHSPHGVVCTDWGELGEGNGFLFSRDEGLKVEMGNYVSPYIRYRVPAVHRGLKAMWKQTFLIRVSPARQKSEMPPRKKRKVESDKPTKETKQGKKKTIDSYSFKYNDSIARQF